MKRGWVWLGVAAIGAAFMVGAPVEGAFAAGKSKSSGSGSSTERKLQLQAFIINVQESGRRKRTNRMPITVYIDTTGRKGSEYVCAVAPRVRAAVFAHLSDHVYKLNSDGEPDLRKIRAEITPIIKSSVRQKVVADVSVRTGTPRVKSAAASQFARSGCIGVSEELEAGGGNDKPAKGKTDAKAKGGHS